MNETLLGGDDQTLDPNKNYFEELVGENKKFKTQEDLARGKFESDNYVSLMERRMDQMREDYIRLQEESKSQASLRELIDQLKQNTGSEPTQQQPGQPQQAYNPDEIKSLVSNTAKETYLEIEKNKRERDNFSSVEVKLKERYGENYKNVLEKQLHELDLTEEQVNSMARTNPKVLIRTLGLDQPQRTENFQAPPSSSSRTDNFSPTAGPKRTWSYYQEMKKKNWNQYMDPKTQIQMQQDAITLGEAFKDGDYNRYR